MSAMTLKDLREALALIGTGHDNKLVVVSLPDSKIVNLETALFLRDGKIMIEGNASKPNLKLVE
jgi:hypothetical protein